MKLEPEMLSKYQRAAGRVEIAFLSKKNVFSLAHLYQSGCLKALMPKNHSHIPEVVLINTAGGITGGDRLSIGVELRERVQATVTTQTAERIYKANNDLGKIDVKLDLKQGSILDWIPQETILFDKSAVKREITVNMHKTSKLFMVESIILGRSAMGETLTNNFFVDHWRILQENKIRYTESLNLSNASELSGLATLGENKALATLLYVASNAEEKVQHMRALLKQCDLVSAASAWDGKLVTRLISDSPQRLRAALVFIISEFRKKQLPRVWLM